VSTANRARASGGLLLLVALSATACRSPEHYFTRGQHAETVALKIAYYTASLDAKPDQVVVLRERGASLILAGEHARAKTDLDRALELGGEHAKTLCNRAVAHLELNQRDQARADLERALVLEPELAEAHDNLGRVRELSGQFPEALAAYGRAIEVDPRYAIAHLNRGRLRFRLGNHADARSDYLEAIDKGDQVLGQLAYQDLVCTWLAERKVTQALDALTEAQVKLPGSPRWVYLLGALLYIQGKYREAGQCLAEAHLRRYQREYCYVFMALATKRVYDQDHHALMRDILASEGLSGWPRPILECYAGTRTPAEVLAGVTTEEDKAIAGYYLGELALIDGDATRAHEHFALAAKADSPTTPEKHLAALRLMLAESTG